MIALVAGFGTGLGLAGLMRARGMLRDPGAQAATLAAIAAFWPVFAMDDGTGLALHFAVATLFWIAAVLLYPDRIAWIGWALIAHGAFDLTQLGAALGPDWWPFFCAGVDVVLGAAVVWSARA